MNVRPMLIVNGVLIAAMVAMSAWAWSQVPDAVPVHWNIDGKVDRIGSKQELLIVSPAVAAFVTMLMALLPRIDPRRANLEASARFWNVSAVLSVALLAYVHGILIWNALGHQVDMTSALLPALSLLFIGIGNYLGKTRSNWFGGIRTPWTLSSDYAWERTHRWGGRMMVASGLASLAAWFVVDTRTAFVILIGLVLATSALSFVLSYVFWRADPDRASNGAH